MEEFAALEATQFDSCNPQFRDRVWGLFGEQDTLAHFEPLFLEHYPHLAKWGKGSDPEYKEWFKQANDLAQRGYTFFAFGDGCSCFDHKHRMLLAPEPSTGECLPFPPAGEVE